MDNATFLVFSALWLVGGICIGYHWHRWEARRATALQDEQKREITAVAVPVPGTLGNRPNYRAVALLDQVDALIHRMDEAEMDEVIDEMQRRGW